MSRFPRDHEQRLKRLKVELEQPTSVQDLLELMQKLVAESKEYEEHSARLYAKGLSRGDVVRAIALVVNEGVPKLNPDLARMVASFLDDLPLELGQILSNREHTASTHVTFTNRSKVAATISWLDWDAKEVIYATLWPGEQYCQQTFLGHPWVARTSTGSRMLLLKGDAARALSEDKDGEGSSAGGSGSSSSGGGSSGGSSAPISCGEYVFMPEPERKEDQRPPDARNTCAVVSCNAAADEAAPPDENRHPAFVRGFSTEQCAKALQLLAERAAKVAGAPSANRRFLLCDRRDQCIVTLMRVDGIKVERQVLQQERKGWMRPSWMGPPAVQLPTGCAEQARTLGALVSEWQRHQVLASHVAEQEVAALLSQPASGSGGRSSGGAGAGAGGAGAGQ